MDLLQNNQLLSLHTCVDEPLLYHFDVSTFIDADSLATNAENLIFLANVLIFAINPFFITTQHFTLTDLLVFPKFAFTGCALYR